MKKTNGMAKRIVAAMLSAMMLCSSVQITVAAPKVQQSVTLGQLLAQNYGAQLSDRAKALLTSGYLADDATYSFTAPDAENADGLITVDPENKTVSVKAYSDGEYRWTPVSACVIVDGVSREDIALTESDNEYIGAFAYSGASFGVAVSYALYTTVDIAVQNKILSVPSALWELKGDLSDAAGSTTTFAGLLNTEIKFSLTSMQNVISGTNLEPVKVYKALAKLNKGDNSANPKPVKGIPFSLGSTSTVLLNLSEEEQVLLKDLTDDMKDDAKLAFAATVAEYRNGGDIKNVAGLSGNSATMQTESQKKLRQSEIVYRATSELGTLFGGNLYGTVVTAAMLGIKNSYAALANYDWTRVSGAFRNDLTSAESANLDSMVNALTEADAAYPAAQTDRLLLNSTVVTATVAQATVRVELKASVYPPNTQVPIALSDTVTLFAGAGTGRQQLEETLSQQGIETAAIEQWNDGTVYSLGVENYTRTVTLLDSDGQPYQGQLEADHTYKLAISYTPKTHQVTVSGCGDDIKGGSYGYGYALILPEKQNDADHVYDYTVNGQPYDQGDTVRVTEDTNITRRVGKAWEKLTWGQVVAEAYLPDDAAAAAILASPALDTGNTRLRRPSAQEELFSRTVSGDTAAFYAQTYAADETSARLWQPSVLSAASAENVSFTKDGGVYRAALNGSDDARYVKYLLHLSFEDISQTDAQMLASLPYTLSEEAKRQKNAMNQLAGQEDNLKKVGERIGEILSVVQGDESISDESKDLIDEVYDECTDTYASGGTYLYIYEYVKAYNQLATDAEKLAYYYQNYDKIYAQVDLLYTNLTEVLADEAVRKLLQTNDLTSEYYDRLDEAVAEGSESKADMTEPHPCIRRDSDTLTALANSILNLNSTRQITVTEPPVLTALVDVTAGNVLALDCSGIAAFGKCGDTLYWTLDELGCLTIFGEGDMAFYASAVGDYAPWHVLADRVQSVFITSAAVPAVSQEAFLGVNAQVYYPDMAAWKEAALVGENLGGKLTWQTCRVGNLDAPGSDVDVRDMAALFTYLSMGTIESTSLRTAPDLFEELADVNRDGSVNILDYQVLYQQIRG